MKELSFNIGNIRVGPRGDFFVIAGPCVIESQQGCMDIAGRLVEISRQRSVPVIFKASFDKANRSSINSFRGPGLKKGLQILGELRSELGIPVLTDVHLPEQAGPIAEVVDCLQVPAFLCRQTDLLVACAKTAKPVNVKKGQFVSPMEMKNVVEKIRSAGNEKIMLTERGTFFGYNRLVNDMAGLEIMKGFGSAVVFDATHSTQQPGGLGTASAGLPEAAPVLARAAVAAGANALFLEVHPDPKNAKSDAACIMPLEWVGNVLTVCREIFEIVRQNCAKNR